MSDSDPQAVDVSASPAAVSAAADELAARQWLLTDGRGGYATGNALDLPRRRYDAWLCVLAADGRRVRLVAGADERLFDAGGEHVLTAVHWRALREPSLPAAPRTFRAEPVPTWTTRTAHSTVEKAIAMPPGRAAVLVRWRNVGAAPFVLRVRPLLCGEDSDALLRERSADLGVRRHGADVEFALATAAGPIWLALAGNARFRAEPHWYRDFWFADDAARGYDAVADRIAPGVIEAELAPGDTIVAAFSAQAPLPEPAALFGAAAQQRAERRAWAGRAQSGLAQRLRRGVDDFFWRAADGRLGVLAGFPWFLEWGRDTFIALPGLTLAVGEPQRCGEVLAAARPFVRAGLLPNVFGRTPADSHYGSADAALWYALCVQRWHDAGASTTAVRAEFGPVLQQMATAYLQGTDLGLRVDDDGLLCAGSRAHNATWMDAQTGSGPVTPRDGQPVEIAALWCALLQHLAELCAGDWPARASAAGAAFVRAFWRDDARCLFDRRHDGRGDPALRPNMVIAAALPRSPLSPAQRQGVVDTAVRELLTPRGLRTLAPGDAAYRGRYEGGPEQRDLAYHQGTAWPWLGGFFVEASLRAAAPAQRATVRARLLAWLQGFTAAVDRGGGDHLAEVFDGDAPQRPGGTFAQAWNTGELLRALALCSADVATGVQP